MRTLIIGALLLLGSISQAQTLSTPGAIASFLQLSDTQFQYEPVADLSILTRAQTTQFTLSVLPTLEPDFAMQQILIAFNAQQYLPEIKKTTIAGYPAADVHAKLETSNWWIVVQMPELSLFVRVEDRDDARSRQSDVEKLAASVRFAGASLPPLVSGDYTMSSSYSGSYSSDLSTYGESSISLQTNGRFSTSSYVGITGANVSGYTQGDNPGGWWQVRGNRILAYEPPNSFYNYRFEAFSNGLEIYNESNEKLLWVRK